MKPHKHADAIKAWADGAEIQVLVREKYRNPEWLVIQDPSWDEAREYRVKPKPAPWYENIPPQGVLCWVSDDETDNEWTRDGIKEEASVDLVIQYDEKREQFRSKEGLSWNTAFPMTKEEVSELVYQGEEE